MHDGITMVVSTPMLEEVKAFLITETKEIEEKVRLKHEQVMKLDEDSTSLLSKWDYEA